jgi:hypothetical protein
MSNNIVHVRELAAWDLDNYEHRTAVPSSTHFSKARQFIAKREPFLQHDAVLAKGTGMLRDLLLPHTQRPELLTEMSGLDWSVGVADLRSLLAFQRRLSFPADFLPPTVPAAQDWPALVALSFGPARPPECERLHDAVAKTLILRSANPNLQLRFTSDPAVPLSVHTGSPFFEVACFRNRWFLRDGYHRAYTLMQAGVFEIPAVIVYAKTLEELGATRPWFFSEDILFSENPPRVSDFLEDDLILEYDRPALIKTLRITTEEILASASSTGEQL